ncbi:preprotein translocase subunit SecG [Candidatus Dependentiae bacterium]|nr:preprotein translocase subunit SecG [Candidatus Dependentiae bacterium]
MSLLFGFLTTLYALCALLLVLLILIQKGKGSLGIGYMGGSNQMLFGGAGGQDFLQKITWVLGAILMAGALALALMKARQHNVSVAPIERSMPAPEQPAAE